VRSIVPGPARPTAKRYLINLLVSGKLPKCPPLLGVYLTVRVRVRVRVHRKVSQSCIEDTVWKSWTEETQPGSPDQDLS